MQANKQKPRDCLSFEEFSKQAETNSILTNYTELFADLDTPVSIYAKLRNESQDAFLFESVIGGEKIGRYSFIGFKALEHFQASDTDPYEELKNKIVDLRAKQENQLLPFFHQGYVGYFSFESMQRIEPSLELQKSDYPEAYMVLVGSLVVFDHVKQKIFVISNSHYQEGADLKELYEKSCDELTSIEDLINKANPLERLKIDSKLLKSADLEGFESNTGKEEYMKMVEEAKKHIKEGDIFQVVPSHKLRKEVSVDPLRVYRMLRTINPSPYLFIYNVGSEFSLVGSSPEMLVKSSLKEDEQGLYFEAENRPIAGTYKRGKSDSEDEKLIKKLLKDPKETAEHVMLIDLARNDLGRVCQSGSISVPQNMIIEKYSHVLHIVSSVIGKMKKAYDRASGLELLRACFPAGTLSGAPKIEAVNIISKLEKEARGPYGGCIGYFSLDGSVDTGILIRTILVEEKQVTLQAGGGVVADSDPASEWQETLNKAGVLINVIKAC